MTVKQTPKEVSADAFQDPALGELWMDVADIVGDATVAKEVISCLLPRLWNLDWATWERLSLQLSAT